jgi:hypothetical protein
MTTETEMRTITCPGPPPHDFQIPKGRGRPPKYCSDHKPTPSSSNGKPAEEKVPEPSTRARPRPGNKQEPEAARPRPGAPRSEENDGATDEPQALRRPPTLGKSDSGSRAKAETAEKRAVSVQADEVIPRGIDGKPMAKIEFSASELIPTGQYANVTVGPVRITAYIDLARNDDEGLPYFTEQEKDTLIKAANELAEMTEVNIIGIQRGLVLESLQQDNG